MNNHPDLDQLKTSLEYEVSINYKVSLFPYNHKERGYKIDANAPNIWIVIHGFNSSPKSSRIEHFVNSLDEIIRSKQGEVIPHVNTENLYGISPSDQILIMDWSTAAKSSTLKGIPLNYISVSLTVERVGHALSEILKQARVETKQINIIAHSLGSYVGAYAAKFLGGVNTMTLLDPAATYNPPEYKEPIDILENAPRFDEVSNYSIQYGSTSKLGTRDTLTHESYWVDIPGINPNDEHGEILRWFIDNARRPIKSGIASKFNFFASEPQYSKIGLLKDDADVDGWEGTFWAIYHGDGWFTSEPKIFPGKKQRTLVQQALVFIPT
ncbi:alpha/beta hydrolase family protein [Acaryochloris marina]|uniref:Lipase superfamily, putative n=1 Tax=Acaryochloris marina (strain MBIC 11017) TaxID=329726 RepID=A8ZR16_ACAM1|nr:lipase superfamily protein [Acaryochloris marina]ABW33452.1 lipase superfamily, putative [Acaryochloris marina MBIC11017]